MRLLFDLIMELTFFCKRSRHIDCPGEWPVDDNNHRESTVDCSFDIKMTKCLCKCHSSQSPTTR